LKHDEYESERKRKRGQVCMITVDGVTVCIDPSLPLFNEMGRKYSMIIVAILRQKEEGINFNQIISFIPFSSTTIISRRLKKLAEIGIIEKLNSDGHLIYKLTKFGKELSDLLVPLMHLAEIHYGVKVTE
jgi:DNA-binding HxlR family transcriptional regulator